MATHEEMAVFGRNINGWELALCLINRQDAGPLPASTGKMPVLLITFVTRPSSFILSTSQIRPDAALEDLNSLIGTCGFGFPSAMEITRILDSGMFRWSFTSSSYDLTRPIGHEAKP